MYKRFIIALAMLLACMPLAAQNSDADNDIRQRRFKKIDILHLGLGFQATANSNTYVGPAFFAGVGSHRNRLWADAGVKLLFCNPVGSSERVTACQMPLFVTAGANVVRWDGGCLYGGGELAYSLPLTSAYHQKAAGVSVSDKHISEYHATMALRIGVRLGNWDLGVRCERDLAPAMNQKYVFENDRYNYEAIHDQLFERFRLGLATTYFFTF